MAPLRPWPPDLPALVTIPQKIVPSLREASRIIKERFAFDNFPVTGYISDLHGDLQLQHDTAKPAGGVVAIGTTIEGTLRKVHVRMGIEDYNTAAVAHTSGAKVTVMGDLRKEGRSYVVLNPRDIRFHFRQEEDD